MNWDWGPTAGAFLGASIPAVLTYARLRAEGRQHRQDRQWIDAEVLADVQAFLTEIEPYRRTINLNQAEGAEAALWADLERRRDDVRRRLLVVGTGHPSRDVRMLAQRLAVEASNAAISCKHVVSDLLRNRDGNYMDVAKKDHEVASATAVELKAAVEIAGKPPGVLRWWFFSTGQRG